VQQHMVYLLGTRACPGQCVAHRQPRASPFGMRRGHVVGIGALAVADELDVLALAGGLLQQHETGALAD
jgi:hypothetical protein